jgi:hypothetical protein
MQESVWENLSFDSLGGGMQGQPCQHSWHSIKALPALWQGYPSIKWIIHIGQQENENFSNQDRMSDAQESPLALISPSLKWR